MTGEQTSKKKSGGRPLDREEAKRSAVAVRTTPAIKARLLEAANARGRSITQEIEARIEESFEIEALLGDRRTRAVFIEAALQLDKVQAVTGRRWHEDGATYFAAKEMINDALPRLLQSGRPVPPNFEAVNELDAERTQLQERWEKLVGILTSCGAIISTFNALLAFEEKPPSYRAYREQPEDQWHKPDEPGETVTEDDAASIRSLLNEFWQHDERLRSLLPEYHRLIAPWRDEQAKGRAIYQALTAPSAEAEQGPR